MIYGYQSEKLSAARSALMLPHPDGEATSIANAFHLLHLAFHRMDESGLDDNARIWIRKLKELMDTNGLVDPDSVGLWRIKAQQLGTDEKVELSRCVDELAHWFREDR
jgi:hypothetical protein